MRKFNAKESFRVEFLEEAVNFIDNLDEKTRKKIIYNIWKARLSNDNKLFKKLNDEIWEFRTFYNKSYYRLFAFWDKSNKMDTIVIATNGLIKKTLKIPEKDILKAQKIRFNYFQKKLNK